MSMTKHNRYQADSVVQPQMVLVHTHSHRIEEHVNKGRPVAAASRRLSEATVTRHQLGIGELLPVIISASKIAVRCE
ncbi:MAG: hypothetical protein LWX55_04795 [Deltaproteobacteria bacterium]|nr:hypothetical protein [Deltaproteobacteria bacterium]